MILGIVGHEAAKFTELTEAKARAIILKLILMNKPVDKVVSGACHLGGIDVWAIEGAVHCGLPTEEFPPQILAWRGGYRERNIEIARISDLVACIVVKEYPREYSGMQFDYCYHCGTNSHIKSGGCWTTKFARSLGKKTITIEI